MTQSVLPNDVWLFNSATPDHESHFKLSEFANDDGLVMVNPCLLAALEAFRSALQHRCGLPVALAITSGLRTRSDNYRLARRLGWSDHGGVVSRTSRHLPEFGALAADIRAYFPESGQLVPSKITTPIARLYFDYVNDDYPDGHTHVDQRTRAAAAANLYP